MISVFLPCRAGSARVKNKNTRTFAGIDGGLFSIKLESLVTMRFFDELIVSTDDSLVMEIASKYIKQDSRVKIVERPEYLALSTTKTDELIRYVPEIIAEGTVIWTHVTSPFLSGNTYEKALEKYQECTRFNTHDSLMSVKKLQSFLWNKNGPLNYDYSVEKWPMTQNLEPVFEVNSALFIADIDIYRSQNNRIGMNPYLFEISSLESIDIDWEDDFTLAEKLWQVTIN